jgi:uroporphyrinogen-III synthase
MLLVTRPREQASDWVTRLKAVGVPAQALPLLGIQPAPDAQAIDRAWRHLSQARAVMFVSPNAVAGFFANRPGHAPWPLQTLAVAPGPGTAAALVARGIPEALIVQPPADAIQFDSESLWPELAAHDWNGQAVWVARGEGGREWLIQRWQAAGAQVHTVVTYRRGAPQLTPQERTVLQVAIEQPAAHVWLLSSSEALDHLIPMVQAVLSDHSTQAHPLPGLEPPHIGWAAQARALATHPRILDQALLHGLRLARACRADFSSVVAAYNQIHCEP